MELQRKGAHLLVGLFLLLALDLTRFLGKQFILLTLGFILILFLQIEFFRIELKKHIPFVHHLWRDHEKNKLGGEAFFLLGGILSISSFDYTIALAALSMVTFGDLVAALVGNTFHHYPLRYPKHKSWESVLAEFAVDLGLGIFILPHALIAIIMALTATAIETFSIELDDNLLVPLFAGFNGHIILYLLTFFRIL